MTIALTLLIQNVGSQVFLKMFVIIFLLFACVYVNILLFPSFQNLLFLFKLLYLFFNLHFFVHDILVLFSFSRCYFLVCSFSFLFRFSLILRFPKFMSCILCFIYIYIFLI